MTMAEIDNKKVVAGIDLSISSTGLVILFPDFMKSDDPMGGIFSEGIKTKYVKDRSNIYRYIYIVDKIVETLSRYCVDSVAMEGYAYSRAGYGKVFDLSELGGVVKCDIFRKLDILPVLYTAQSARKNMMGKYKRKEQKKQVASFLGSLGIYFKNHDIYDAFAIALKCFDEVNNGGVSSFIDYWHTAYK